MNSEINKDNIPNPIGPYTPVIKIENLIFISGQIASTIDLNNSDNDISIQTTEILNNIKYIIEQANAKIENIIKTTLFIIDLKHLNTINKIYKKFFLNHSTRFPTRSCIGVSKLPNDALIEIEAIAYKK
ncbi:RidA family protein [Buchnera aphidicola]|uniref:RidA family protein n=1 Tax=Buchnera aphidicola subsp. Melaphis rhois TaxID=118103 RepID=A0A4D6YBG7_BUCMH|nr:RidA family protein [Buchnera aphidicola]QCI23354.1 RidA family protein [Buchnera aphidicola (Melaphis rhois)]